MQAHTVQKGETMDAIARRYGLPNGTVVFYAPCNARLKSLRSKPAQIRPGDIVHIPANAVTEAEKRLSSLRKIRADYLAMNETILKEWNSEYVKVTNTASQVDIAGKVLTMLVDLGGIVKEGFGAMKLTGQLLAEANKKLSYSAIKFAYDPLLDVAKDKAAETIASSKPEDGLAATIGKDVLHFFLVDWNTPSYWASKVSGVDINETNRKVVDEIEAKKREMLLKLDARISSAELNLLKLKRVHNGGAPALY